MKSKFVNIFRTHLVLLNISYALCSCDVDMRVAQLVDITPGVRVVLPKAIFNK